MSRDSTRSPRLTVVNGAAAGTVYPVPPGRSTIGREHGSEIRIDDVEISRHHAALEHNAGQVVLTDLNSTNGTWVNGVPVRGARALRGGDVVRVGQVEMLYAIGALAPGGTREYDFGGVRGPVQTGDGVQYAAERDQYVAHGDQYLAGRDRYDQRSWHVRADNGGLAAGRDVHANDYSVRVSNDYNPWDEMFDGKGPGRVLMVLGGLIALAGFAIWVYVIFSGMAGISSLETGPGAGFGESPFDRELVPGVPAAPVGFGAFGVGGLLLAIGAGMSKAARKRAERARSRGGYR